MPIEQYFGWTATFLFSIMMFPQMHKSIKTGTVNGVSPWLFVINLVANFIALTYALLIDQKPLMIKYVLAIITTIAYIGIYLRISRRER